MHRRKTAHRRQTTFPWTVTSRVLITLGLLGLATPVLGDDHQPPCPDIRIGDPKVGPTIPLPCSMPLRDYERALYRWVNERYYTQLGWPHDHHIRDTGPFILGQDYGTHPAVRIYYSPEVYAWMQRREEHPDKDPGELPPGSTIIKEMFDPPAARLEEKRSEYATEEEWEAMVEASLSSWAIMIRDDQTKDGWFWAGPTLVDRTGMTDLQYNTAIEQSLDNNDYPFTFRASEHGQPSCLRCHAIAENQSTFSDLANVTGPGIAFRVDNSWRTNLAKQQRPGGGETETTLFQSAFHGNSSANTKTPDQEELQSTPLDAPNATWGRYFQLKGGSASDPRAFPGQWADHVPAGPDGAEQFITSDNCLGCHGGLGGAPYGVTMFLQTGPDYGDGYNISPFGEWRWSPMGLAGRDPIFYSQLATELAILDGEFEDKPELRDKAKNAVVNTCLSCHGAMGQRQLRFDAAQNPHLDPNFKRDYVYAYTALTEEETWQPNYEYHKYGNLAREGISCAVCHHIDPPQQWQEGMTEDEKEDLFLMHSTTGIFPLSPRDELNGPYDDVLEKPMEHALGIRPEGNDYISDSRMCGTCHTINLPNVDCPPPSEDFHAEGDDADRCHNYAELNRSAKLQAAFLQEQYGTDEPVEYAEFLADNFRHTIEQATYLEWKNSVFGQMTTADGKPNPEYQSCQDCHMPRSFQSLDGTIDIPQLTSQIASIQDSSYPEVENSLPREDITVPFRDDYRRHELVGLNVFLLEMFDQFDPILGVDETDYMTSATTGDKLAVENMLVQAHEKTARVSVDPVSLEGRMLTVDVSVESLTGHRLPSGVGFRRAWIELAVIDPEKPRGGGVVWISGDTNSVGMILDGKRKTPLPTEFFENNTWQPHYDGIQPSGPPPVTEQHQVQIYEEVTLNGDGDVTYSFIHRDQHPKDNRLLPRGWQTPGSFPSEIQRQFMAATQPEGTGNDPDYTEGHTGTDRVRYVIELPNGVKDPSKVQVRATLYSQSFQPYWFKRKFDISGDDPATQRLYYLASHLNTQGTVINDWKLKLVGCTTGAFGDALSAGKGCG